MSALSSRAVAAVTGFAASMGLPAVAARDGSYTFRFDRSGVLSLTPSSDGRRVLVSLARHPSRVDQSGESLLLARAGLDPTTSRFVHAGLAPDGMFVFAVGIDEAEASVPMIESVLDQLIAAHDSIA